MNFSIIFYCSFLAHLGSKCRYTWYRTRMHPQIRNCSQRKELKQIHFTSTDFRGETFRQCFCCRCRYRYFTFSTRYLTLHSIEFHTCSCIWSVLRSINGRLGDWGSNRCISTHTWKLSPNQTSLLQSPCLLLTKTAIKMREYNMKYTQRTTQ